MNNIYSNPIYCDIELTDFAYNFANGWKVSCNKNVANIIKGTQFEYICHEIDKYILDIVPLVYGDHKECDIESRCICNNKFRIWHHYANFYKSVGIELIAPYDSMPFIIRFKDRVGSMDKDDIVKNIIRVKKGINRNNELYLEDEDCFGCESISSMMSGFNFMISNYSICDVENLIYTHSIFGRAFYNAMHRVGIYNGKHNEGDVTIPENIVMEEFKKIIKKLKFRGVKINKSIEQEFID